MKNTKKIFTKIGVHYDEDQFIKIKAVDVDMVNKLWEVKLYCSRLITEDYYSNIVSCFRSYYKKEVNVRIVLELENSRLSDQAPNIIQGHYKRLLMTTQRRRLQWSV